MDQIANQQTDSPQLWKLESANRTKLIRLHLRATGAPVSQLSASEKSLRVYTTGYLLCNAYTGSKEYENIDEISDEMLSGDGDITTELDALANKVWRFIGIVTDYPAVQPYAKMINAITQIILGNRHEDLDDDDIHDITSLMLEHVNEYASDLKAIFDGFDDSATIAEVDEFTRGITWRDITLGITPSPEVDNSEVKIALDKLRMAFYDYTIDDRLAKFIMTPSLGSAGLAYVSKLMVPLAVNILPHRLINRIIAQDIWFLDYYPSGDTLTNFLSRTDDTELQALESNAWRSLGSNLFRNHASKLSEHLSDKRSSRVSGNSSSGTGQKPSEDDSKKDDKKGEDRRGPDPDADPEAQTTGNIPDDDDYTPNAGLYRKVRDLTKFYQSSDDMNMEKDHMTRFSTTNETPVGLSRLSVRRTDVRVYSGQGTNGNMFVVTFTRKSRKPIFNPVA